MLDMHYIFPKWKYTKIKERGKKLYANQPLIICMYWIRWTWASGEESIEVNLMSMKLQLISNEPIDLHEQTHWFQVWNDQYNMGRKDHMAKNGKMKLKFSKGPYVTKIHGVQLERSTP